MLEKSIIHFKTNFFPGIKKLRHLREDWRMWQKFPFRGNCCINEIRKRISELISFIISAHTLLLNNASEVKEDLKNNCLASCLLYRKEHGLVQNSSSSRFFMDCLFILRFIYATAILHDSNWIFFLELLARTTCSFVSYLKLHLILRSICVHLLMKSRM